MIGAIALFELRQRVRRLSFVAFYLLFAALAFMLFISSAGAFTGVTVGLGAGGKVTANAPFAVHTLTVLLAALGLLLTAAVMGQAVYQDVHARIDALFFTAPVRPRDYLLGRFIGGIAFLVVLYSSIGVGLLVGSWMPFLEPSLIGPNRLAAYVLPYFTGVLPTLVFTGAVFFSMAALTRQMRAVYATSVVLLMGYLVATSITVEPENRVWGALLDPFGLLATDYVTQYWSLADKNERLVTLGGMFLWNRVAWTAVGLGLLTWTIGRFRFAHDATGGASKAPKDARAAAPVVGPLITDPSDSDTSPWALLPGLTWLAFKETVKNVYFLVIVLCGVLFLFVTAKDLGSMFGTNTYPVTYKVLDLSNGVFSLFMVISIILFAGELVWRERDQGMDQLLDASPLPTALPLVSKLLALGLVQVLMSAVVLVCGLMIQIALGYHHFELGQYLGSLFGIVLVRNLLFCVLAVFVHVVVNDKVVGHGVMILYFILNMFSRRFGFEHNLYRYGSRPQDIYSDMNGWGHFLEPIVWFDVYWALFAGLLVVVASLLWVRGKEDSWRFRLRLVGRRFNARVKVATAGLALGWLGVGGFIFYNTNVLNEYVTDNGERALSADYERTYRAHRAEPMPRVTAVDVAWDVYPERRGLDAKVTYRLKNTSTATISTIYVTETPEVHVELLTIAGAPAVEKDLRLGLHTFRLAKPLPPGAETELRFQGRYESRGFRNGHFVDRLAENGTFVDSGVLPTIGYEEAMELQDDDARKKESLPPRERMPDLHDEAARAKNYVTGHADWVTLHSVVTTALDQRGVAPGTLVRESEENGRRRFEYQIEVPCIPYFAMLSGRWATKTGSWRANRESSEEVKIEVWYHPGHEYDVDRMIEAVRDTLEYLTKTIGPYPHRVVRIVEFPRYETFAQGFPSMIPFSESVGFIAKVDPEDEEDVDYPYYVTAHEVAHQWWANQVLGANVQGATVLSESLAQYSALMVMKRSFGPLQMRRYLRYALDRYLRGRSQERKKELPLLRVENQPYIHYEKGSLVFYALQDHLGEDVVNGALRGFFEANRWKAPPYPTSEELLTAIRRVAPPEAQALITDLFEKITLFELKAEQAKAKKLADGRWAVTMEVTAKKLYADELGKESEAPLQEHIDVGVLGKKGKVLVLERHLITAPRSTFTATVSEAPERAGIDPLNELVDRDPDDNTAKVTLE